MADLTNLIAAGPPAYSLNLAGLFDAMRKGKDAEVTDRNRDLYKNGVPMKGNEPDWSRIMVDMMRAGGAEAIPNAIKAGNAAPDVGYSPITGQQYGGGQAPVQGGAPGSYEGNLAHAESGNNPNAQNPKSSAGGLFQFLDGTWEGLQKKYPQLGLTDKFNPDQQKKAERAFRFDNAKALKTSGQEVNEQNLSLSHFLGAGGANRFLSQYGTSPDSPAAAFVDPKAVAANKHLFFRGQTPISAGDFYSGFNSNRGGTQVAQAQPQGDPTLGGLVPAGIDPGAYLRSLLDAARVAEKKQPGSGRPFLEMAATVRQAMEPTPGQKEARAAGFGPGGQQKYELQKTQAEADIKNKSAYTEKENEYYGGLFGKMQDEGRTAGRQIATYDLMKNITYDENFYSGTAADKVQAFKRFIASTGIDPGNSAPNELFQKLSNKLVIDSSEHGLSQGISSTDRIYLANANANAGASKEGNRAILDNGKKLEQRKQVVAQRARDYRKSHGGIIDAGFDEELATWAKANPLFPASEKKDDGAGWTTVGGIKIREKR